MCVCTYVRMFIGEGMYYVCVCAYAATDTGPGQLYVCVCVRIPGSGRVNTYVCVFVCVCVYARVEVLCTQVPLFSALFTRNLTGAFIGEY